METKKAINRTYGLQRMQSSVKNALGINYTIKSHRPPDKDTFIDVARERGMRGAIAWRNARFSPPQQV